MPKFCEYHSKLTIFPLTLIISLRQPSQLNRCSNICSAWAATYVLTKSSFSSCYSYCLNYKPIQGPFKNVKLPKILPQKKNLPQSRARFSSSFTHTNCSASARYKIWNITNASTAAYLRAEPAIIGVATPSHAPRARREAPTAADMRTTTAKTTTLTHGLLLVCILLCCDERRRDGAHCSPLTKHVAHCRWLMCVLVVMNCTKLLQFHRITNNIWTSVFIDIL